MRGPLAAAVVVACAVLLVAVVELARDVWRSRRGRAVDRSWRRRMGRFFGPSVPAVAGWGLLVRIARHDATIGDYALLFTACMAVAVPATTIAGVMMKRRFSDELAGASESSLDFRRFSRPLKRFGIVATLVVIGLVLGVLLTLDALGWVYVDLERGPD